MWARAPVCSQTKSRQRAKGLLDRVMSKFDSPFHSKCGSHRARLTTYKPIVQQYGTFFSAFPWQAYCTGTYRKRKAHKAALETFDLFIRILQAKLKCRLAYVAVPEKTTSGLGRPAGPWHWHFVVCGPDHRKTELLELTPRLWQELNGDAHVVPYDHQFHGGRYLAKTACQVDFDYVFGNLAYLPMPVNLDLFEQQMRDTYVPEHVRHRLTGETLTLRTFNESRT